MSFAHGVMGIPLFAGEDHAPLALWDTIILTNALESVSNARHHVLYGAWLTWCWVPLTASNRGEGYIYNSKSQLSVS